MRFLRILTPIISDDRLTLAFNVKSKILDTHRWFTKRYQVPNLREWVYLFFLRLFLSLILHCTARRGTALPWIEKWNISSLQYKISHLTSFCCWIKMRVFTNCYLVRIWMVVCECVRMHVSVDILIKLHLLTLRKLPFFLSKLKCVKMQHVKFLYWSHLIIPLRQKCGNRWTKNVVPSRGNHLNAFSIWNVTEQCSFCLVWGKQKWVPSSFIWFEKLFDISWKVKWHFFQVLFTL